MLIGYSSDPNRFYTVIFYDVSAPYPDENYNSPYVNYLVSNVPGDQLEKGQEVFSYMPPQPSRDSGAHTYIVDVYEQQAKKRVYPRKVRDSFDLTNYVTTYNLIQPPVATLNFQVGYPDIERPPSPAEVLPVPYTDDYIIRQAPLDESQKKYCRCVLKVAAKQPGSCNREKAWYQKRSGRTCVNPYAICAKSVGTTSQCEMYYNWDAIADSELIAFADLKQLNVPDPYDRDELLQTIEDHLAEIRAEKIRPLPK